MSFRILAASVLFLLAGCSADQPVPVSQPAAVQLEPLRVLHEWDAARSLAWEHADPVALEGLYLPRSTAGVEDVALLKRYAARGVRLRGIRMQVLSARIVVKRETRMQLVVVERFAGAHAETASGARSLPAGRPVRRIIDLRRYSGRWLVAAVRSLPLEGPR